MQRASLPIALTIAGSDSGGGAGIQADLKTFDAHRVHGASAITCLTAQNPRQVRGVAATAAEFVRAQIGAVFAELPPNAIKTGMLFSAEIIKAVADALKQAPGIPLVVDPVLVATSGARLLQEDAISALMAQLLPQAAVITPNLHEAEALLGISVSCIDEMRGAAMELSRRFGCATLIKGGHLPIDGQVVDILHANGRTTDFKAGFVEGIKTHGTGCTLSAAICAQLALGRSIEESVGLGKQFIERAIHFGSFANGHFVLNIHRAGEP